MEMFLAVLLGVVASDAPVVSNPGFEQVREQQVSEQTAQAREQTGQAQGWGLLPQGWHLCYLPNEEHLVRYETKAGEGQESRALLITVADDHPDKLVCYNATQDVPCFIAGKSYRVSARVKTSGLHNMPFICVQCLDSSGSKFVGFAGTPKRALDADIEQWERIETKITVPEGTATFRLRVGISSEGNAGGTAMIDDVEVVETSAGTALSNQFQSESPHRIPLAVLDVAKVFKEARDFNQKMQSMKLEIASFDRTVKASRREQSDSLPPDLKAFAVAKKDTFLSDEAQAYAETYRAIENAVQRICRERDIGLVIRATTEPMDPKDRSSVLQGVNRPIVYTAVPDLTADVIAALNKSSQ